tara:strand:+ start:1479 stop:2939 length:1461 start_codon:yes stop_codon:yes gene_type:complete
MGSLHAGHSQLIKVAKRIQTKNNSKVLVSVFVNPLQFGDGEDFDEYPRDLNRDSKFAFKSGANALWAPSVNEIFPKENKSFAKINAPEHLKTQLCGLKRKGHFDGVATVIIRLLQLVKPEILVLGEKDWQQLIIIRELIQQFELPITIKGVATHRDPDGLASSSRNVYLTKGERKKALALPNSLQKASQEYKKGKEINLETIKSYLVKNDLIVEYLEAVDPESLQPIKSPKTIKLLAASVRIGKTRLIDHSFLMTNSPIVAIDGPAGAGKSTVTRKFAKKMGLIFLDTGAMYRAVTWLIYEKGINPKDEKTIAKELESLRLKMSISKSGIQKVFVNEEDVTDLIRSQEISLKVSEIAAQQAVREALTLQQKQIGLKGGLVAEGRDIGTAVFPNAILKIFLTASVAERAKRRANDLKERGLKLPNLIELQNQIKERDEIDSTRKIAPLLKAKDAKEIITDGMNIDEVIDQIINLFRLKVPEEVWPSP